MAEPLLPPSVVRGIGDKLYNKRKHSALEIEQVDLHHSSAAAGWAGLPNGSTFVRSTMPGHRCWPQPLQQGICIPAADHEEAC